MSKWKDISSVTVPKAENANRLDGKIPLTYMHTVGSIYSEDALNNFCNEIGATTQTVYGPKIPGSVASFCGLMPSNESYHYSGMGFQLWGTTYNRGLYYRNIGTTGNGGNGTWQKVAMEGSVVSLTDLEKIMALDSKEERLTAITTLKAEKLKQIEINPDNMIKNDVIEHNGGGYSGIFLLDNLLVSVAPKKGGPHEQVESSGLFPICHGFSIGELFAERNLPRCFKFRRYNRSGTLSNCIKFTDHRISRRSYWKLQGWSDSTCKSNRDCWISNTVFRETNKYSKNIHEGEIRSYLGRVEGICQGVAARKEVVA